MSSRSTAMAMAICAAVACIAASQLSAAFVQPTLPVAAPQPASAAAAGEAPEQAWPFAEEAPASTSWSSLGQVSAGALLGLALGLAVNAAPAMAVPGEPALPSKLLTRSGVMPPQGEWKVPDTSSLENKIKIDIKTKPAMDPEEMSKAVFKLEGSKPPATPEFLP